MGEKFQDVEAEKLQVNGAAEVKGSLTTAAITQVGNLTQTGNQTITGNQTQTGNLTLTGDLSVTGDVTVDGQVTASLGFTQRVTPIYPIKSDINTVGTVAEMFINVPVKAKLVKFGIMSAASDVVCSSSTTFELRTVNGTKVATFVPGSCVLGSGAASGAAPETATYLIANKSYGFCIGTNPGDSGSVIPFVDYQTED